MNLKKLNKIALDKKIKEIEQDKSTDLYKANKHLFSGSTWLGGGELTLGGFIEWKADCELLLTDAITGCKAVLFEASGTGVIFGAVECEVAGAFVVNPSTIGGKCHFTIAVGAVGEGAVTLFLYSTTGSLYGNFTGLAEGAIAGGVTGSGNLIVS